MSEHQGNCPQMKTVYGDVRFVEIVEKFEAIIERNGGVFFIFRNQIGNAVKGQSIFRNRN